MCCQVTGVFFMLSHGQCSVFCHCWEVIWSYQPFWDELYYKLASLIHRHAHYMPSEWEGLWYRPWEWESLLDITITVDLKFNLMIIWMNMWVAICLDHPPGRWSVLAKGTWSYPWTLNKSPEGLWQTHSSVVMWSACLLFQGISEGSFSYSV